LTRRPERTEHGSVRTANPSVASRPVTIAWLLAAGAVVSCAASTGSDALPTMSAASPTTVAGSSLPGSPIVDDEPFTLTSSTIPAGGSVPVDSTCDGQDRSPDLAWSGAPDGTTSLALIVDDPDADDFVHWIVLDLPDGPTGELAPDIRADATSPRQGRNDFGRIGWGGPCPPSGTHRYRFTLVALNGPLGLTGHPDGSAVRAALADAAVLGQARLDATYRRR
jgi:Raf kinase inhibitor-like YbhB/YbcL family protein